MRIAEPLGRDDVGVNILGLEIRHDVIGPASDVLGIDSEYDYDPVWAKCVEPGIAPTFHSVIEQSGPAIVADQFVNNHIGHFAAPGLPTAKAIFLGGVAGRFPELRLRSSKTASAGPASSSAI